MRAIAVYAVTRCRSPAWRAPTDALRAATDEGERGHYDTNGSMYHNASRPVIDIVMVYGSAIMTMRP